MGNLTETGIHDEENNRKMGMGLRFEQNRLGSWNLNWDFD